jgi:hypothetical protein
MKYVEKYFCDDISKEDRRKIWNKVLKTIRLPFKPNLLEE